MAEREFLCGYARDPFPCKIIFEGREEEKRGREK
jgi:hypothetical protein